MKSPLKTIVGRAVDAIELEHPGLLQDGSVLFIEEAKSEGHLGLIFLRHQIFAGLVIHVLPRERALAHLAEIDLPRLRLDLEGLVPPPGFSLFVWLVEGRQQMGRVWRPSAGEMPKDLVHGDQWVQSMLDQAVPVAAKQRPHFARDHARTHVLCVVRAGSVLEGLASPAHLGGGLKPNEMLCFPLPIGTLEERVAAIPAKTMSLKERGPLLDAVRGEMARLEPGEVCFLAGQGIRVSAGAAVWEACDDESPEQTERVLPSNNAPGGSC